MKTYKFLMILVLAIFFGIGAQTDCDQNKITKNAAEKVDNKTMTNQPLPDPTPNQTPSDGIIKLTQGSNAKIQTPFIFVARTKETYAQMQTMVENLPPVDGIDFNKIAIVAAFAGEKSTGGYSVSINGTSRANVSVKVNSPPPDAIVTQALTMPYLVVSVPVGEQESLAVDLSENWMRSAQTYKVTGGEFEYSGGFVGKEVKFDPEGSIKFLQSGEFITLLFDLVGKADANDRTMNDVASGSLKNEKAYLPRLEAMTFIEQPHPPFIVSGTISNEKMSLTFEKGKRDYVVNDGFEGSGKLVAVKRN